jgi:hypothetical protein
MITCFFILGGVVGFAAGYMCNDARRQAAVDEAARADKYWAFELGEARKHIASIIGK